MINLLARSLSVVVGVYRAVSLRKVDGVHRALDDGVTEGVLLAGSGVGDLSCGESTNGVVTGTDRDSAPSAVVGKLGSTSRAL